MTTVTSNVFKSRWGYHSADYDTTEVFSRPDVLSTIDLVDQAFAAWKAVKDTPNANAFLAALLLNRHWRAKS